MEYEGEVNPEDYFSLITQNTQKMGQMIQVINQTKTHFDEQISNCQDSNISDLINMCKGYALKHCSETADVIHDIGIDLSCLLAHQASRVQNITLRLNSIQSKMISHEQKAAVNYSREITFLRSYIPRRLKYQKITQPLLPPGFESYQPGTKIPDFDHQPLNLRQKCGDNDDDDWMPPTQTRDHSYSVAPTLQKSNLDLIRRANTDWRSKVAHVELADTSQRNGQNDMSFFMQTPTGKNVKSYVPTPTASDQVTFVKPEMNFAASHTDDEHQPEETSLKIVKLSDLKGAKPTAATPTVAPMAPPSAPSAPSAPMAPPSAPHAPPPPSSGDDHHGGHARTPSHLPPPPRSNNPPPPSAPMPPPPQQQHDYNDYNDYNDYTQNNNDYNDYSHIAPPPAAAPAPPPPSTSFDYSTPDTGYSQDQTREAASSSFDAFARPAPLPPTFDNPPTSNYQEPEPQNTWDQQQQEQATETQEEEQIDGYYDDAGNWWYRDYDGEYKMWIPPAE